MSPNPTLGYAHDPNTECGFQQTLLQLARDARQRGRHELAALAAEDGLRSPSYQTEFLEELSISGYYSALPQHRQKAADACEQLLRSRETPEPQRNLARSNSQFYARSLSDQGLGRSWQLELQVADGYVPMNTTLAWKNGELWAVVRTVNYRYIDSRYITAPGQPVNSINLLVQLGPESQVQNQVTLEEPPRGRPDSLLIGQEDLRLFVWRDRFFATATVLDHNPDYRAQIALLEFDREGKALGFKLLDEPRPLVNQKNWMPLVDGDNVWLLLYAEPTLWAKLEPARGNLQFLSCGQPPLALADIRGGSGWVRWTRPQTEKSGWLAVVHDAQVGPDGWRVYLHRFLWMSADGQLSQLSRPFNFFNTAIEYCSGLAPGFAPDTFWLGVGRHDCESHIVELTSAEIESLFAPATQVFANQPPHLNHRKETLARV